MFAECCRLLLDFWLGLLVLGVLVGEKSIQVNECFALVSKPLFVILSCLRIQFQV